MSYRPWGHKESDTTELFSLSFQVDSIVAETSNRETKHRTWRVGEFRLIMPMSPEELTL